MKYYNKEMPTIHPENCVALTWEDAEAMEKLNNACGWSFAPSDILRFIADHMEAYMNVGMGNDPLEAYLTMEKIEWRLEDANFHTLCKMLSETDYKKAIAWVVKEVIE